MLLGVIPLDIFKPNHRRYNFLSKQSSLAGEAANVQFQYVERFNLSEMEHAFQTCVHCGTLNFEGRKMCSCCKFRLPITSVTEEPHEYRHWNTVIVGAVLVAIGLIVAAAFMIDPY